MLIFLAPKAGRGHWTAGLLCGANPWRSGFLEAQKERKRHSFRQEETRLPTEFTMIHPIAGLLNATFGNAVEMIISVFALQKGLTEAGALNEGEEGKRKRQRRSFFMRDLVGCIFLLLFGGWMLSPMLKRKEKVIKRGSSGLWIIFFHSNGFLRWIPVPFSRMRGWVLASLGFLNPFGRLARWWRAAWLAASSRICCWFLAPWFQLFGVRGVADLGDITRENISFTTIFMIDCMYQTRSIPQNGGFLNRNPFSNPTSSFSCRSRHVFLFWWPQLSDAALQRQRRADAIFPPLTGHPCLGRLVYASRWLEGLGSLLSVEAGTKKQKFPSGSCGRGGVLGRPCQNCTYMKILEFTGFYVYVAQTKVPKKHGQRNKRPKPAGLFWCQTPCVSLRKTSLHRAEVIPTVVLLTGVRPESELLISRGCVAWSRHGEVGEAVCGCRWMLMVYGCLMYIGYKLWTMDVWSLCKSRWSEAIVLAILYVCYLIFQLVTHKASRHGDLPKTFCTCSLVGTTWMFSTELCWSHWQDKFAACGTEGDSEAEARKEWFWEPSESMEMEWNGPGSSFHPWDDNGSISMGLYFTSPDFSQRKLPHLEEPSLSPGMALVCLVGATLLVAPLSEALTGPLVWGGGRALGVFGAFRETVTAYRHSLFWGKIEKVPEFSLQSPFQELF